MEEWLNDTTVDGFLGNLRDYENFIVTDAKWDATEDNRKLDDLTRPDGTTVVTDAVGLLNMYEYKSTHNEANYRKSYLLNNLTWWSLTPYDSVNVYGLHSNGSEVGYYSLNYAVGVRPSVVLKSNVTIVSGSGTVYDPYRLLGDNDEELSGTLLNTRYSGEYIHFGNAENNLYRIVSHEQVGLTKITSAEPLKENENFISLAFDTNKGVNYASSTIYTFLNKEFLTYYLDNNYNNMIENSSIWYIGQVGSAESYKLAKYRDGNVTNSVVSKIGLLRLGELMSGQFDTYNDSITYWTLTLYSNSVIRTVGRNSNMSDYGSTSSKNSIKPALNLKSNVIITSGDGTKENPFEIELLS